MGTALISGLSFLAIAAPEHRQAEVAIGAEWQRHGDPEHDPVEAEAQGLVPLGREHGVEEDAAEGDLGPALVAERVIDDDPDDPAGDGCDRANAKNFSGIRAILPWIVS